MRIVQKLLGPDDRRVGQAGRFQFGGELVFPVRRKDQPEAREEIATYRDALRICRERGLVSDVRTLEHVAQRPELLVAHGADE